MSTSLRIHQNSFRLHKVLLLIIIIVDKNIAEFCCQVKGEQLRVIIPLINIFHPKTGVCQDLAMPFTHFGANVDISAQ